VSQLRDDGSPVDGILWGCMFMVILGLLLLLTIYVLGEAGVIAP
jgi:hypothetical protein